MTTGQTVSWTTEKGYYYVADPAAKGIRYRIETRGPIQSRPAYWTPNLYACSTDGSMYAVNEFTGKITWKYSVGDAIYASPVAIEDKVFVVSETSGLYCLDAKAGAVIWNAAGIRQFVSASPSRVYAIDQLGRLAVLDAKRGARLGSMPLEGISLKVVNSQSDRIYLVSDTSLVQCLRQTDLKTPLVYAAPPPPPVVDEADKPKRPVSKPPATPAEPAEDAADAPAGDAMPAEPDNADEPAGEDPFK
jgi:outer membrane protein assembly factor BamB